MQDTDTTPAPDQDQPTADEGATPPDTADTDLAAELEKWKRQSRKNEQRAKENAEAARRLAEIEESQKSEAQRLADTLAAAEARAQAAEARANRLEVITETGLPAELHEFLVGSDPDELRAQAEKLKAAVGSRRPAPDPSQGVKNTPSAPPQLTREDVQRLVAAGRHDEVARAKAEGRLNSLLGIT